MTKSERTNPVEQNGEPHIFLPANVSLHIMFSPHDTREDLGDFEAFKQKVRSACQ